MIKSIEQLEKEYKKASEKCVDNAYDPEKEEWNPEHFQYCEGDTIARLLDQTNAILDLIDKMLKEGLNGRRYNFMINGEDLKDAIKSNSIGNKNNVLKGGRRK